MPEPLYYLDPLWYYNHRYSAKPHFFPDYIKLSQEEKAGITLDQQYKILATEDASFQAFKRGVIPVSSSESKTVSPAPAEDLYYFIARYYHKGWLLFFWIVRVLKAHSFFKELFCLIRFIKIKKADLHEKTLSYPVAETQLPEGLKVSIIIPTLNRYGFLEKFLKDLFLQSILPYEVIIIDQSEPENSEFYNQFKHLPLQVFFRKEKGQWNARNKAISISKGEFLLFADDDSRVDKNWIENHLKCLFYFKADISAGVSIDESNQPGKDKTFFHLAEEFDSGNAMVRREVFKAIGLFDRSFDGYRMGDTEFGLRAFLSGLKSISNPLAGRVHVKANKGGMRFWGSKRAFKPVSFFGSRPDPGTLYLFHRYYDKKYLYSFLLPRILISYIPSALNRNLLGWLIGFSGFVLFFPVWYSKLLKNLTKVRKMKPQIISFKEL